MTTSLIPTPTTRRRVFLLVNADPRQRDWHKKWARLNDWGEIIPLLDDGYRVFEDPLATYALMLDALEKHKFIPETDLFAWVWGNPFPLLLMGVLLEKFEADSFTFLQIRRDRRDDGSYDDDTLRFEPVHVPLGMGREPDLSHLDLDPDQLAFDLSNPSDNDDD